MRRREQHSSRPCPGARGLGPAALPQGWPAQQLLAVSLLQTFGISLFLLFSVWSWSYVSIYLYLLNMLLSACKIFHSLCHEQISLIHSCLLLAPINVHKSAFLYIQYTSFVSFCWTWLLHLCHLAFCRKQQSMQNVVEDLQPLFFFKRIDLEIVKCVSSG